MSPSGFGTPAVLRGIGRWDLVALMVNITIGAGILGLPAKLFDLTHGSSVLALVSCAILIGAIEICFAEVGSRFVDSGGPYLIARTALGPSAGFVVGWIYWIARVLTFATISNLVVAYVARFLPGAAAGVGRATLITLVVGGITLVHLFGIRHATVVTNALTVLKVGFLSAFGVLGLLSATGSLPQLGTPPPIDAFGRAILLGTFAFSGFEASMVAAGEMREPRRDIPFAIAGSLVIVLLLYLGALLANASRRELIQLGVAASSGILVYALFGSAVMRARRCEALKLSNDRE